MTTPGDYITEELIARSWYQKELAWIMGRSPANINKIINGRIRLTPATALLLERVFGVSAETWMKRENIYRLSSISR